MNIISLSGLLHACDGQIASQSGYSVLVARELLHFPLVLMNRLNKTESAVF